MKYLITYDDEFSRTKPSYRIVRAGTRLEARQKMLSLVHRIIFIREVKAYLERKTPKKKMLTRKQ